MTFGLLINRFAELAKARRAYAGPDASQEAMADAARSDAFSPELAHLRDELGHHLVPLVLMSRCDGVMAPAEVEIVLEYCGTVTRLSDQDRERLADHVASMRPMLLQLEPCLKRIVYHESHHLPALMRAAERIIVCDGRIEPEEMTLLDLIRGDVAGLTD